MIIKNIYLSWFYLEFEPDTQIDFITEQSERNSGVNFYFQYSSR